MLTLVISEVETRSNNLIKVKKKDIFKILSFLLTYKYGASMTILNRKLGFKYNNFNRMIDYLSPILICWRINGFHSVKDKMVMIRPEIRQQISLNKITINDLMKLLAQIWFENTI